MSYPVGVIQRTVRFKAPFILEDGETLVLEGAIGSSIPNLIWQPTGQRALSRGKAISVTVVGDDLMFEVPVTDQSDKWLLPNGLAIEPGMHTHTWSVHLQAKSAATGQRVGAEININGLIVPQGAGVLDASILSEYTGPTGIPVVQSEPWQTAVSQAQQAAIEARAAADEITAGGGPGQPGTMDYTELLNKPFIPDSPDDIGAATAAQGAKADAAVPSTRKVNGKALSGDITLAAGDVGAATSAQGAKADSAVQGDRLVNGKALSADITLSASDVGAATAAQGAKADAAVPSTRKVNGKALSADIALAAGDVGAATSAQGAKADAALPAATFAQYGIRYTLFFVGGTWQTLASRGLTSAFPEPIYWNSEDTKGAPTPPEARDYDFWDEAQ